ncbi:MAG: 23S rRNA (pseudouridine(1915)-N(3))-methyltransferase RlmH [Pseudomonadota bacterium]
MRITIAAVGRLRNGPIRDLISDYTKRLPWDLTIREIAEGRQPGRRKDDEATALLATVTDGAGIIALDERGKDLTSEALADWLAKRQDDGQRDWTILIGGADGLGALVLDRADMVLSLGRLTWPHMLARLLVVEQLYRAHTIQIGHPYHRE